MNSSPKRWSRFLAEGGVIVGSILLALFLDASWDTVQKRGEERETLRSLRGEFDENRILLAELVDVHRTHMCFLSGFYGSPRSGCDPLPPDSTALRVNAAFSQVMTFDASMSTLEALVGAGQMNLLRDATLRTELTRWRREVEDSREEANAMLATLNESIDLLHAAEALEAPGVPWARFSPGADRRLRESRELERHALTVSFWRGQYLSELIQIAETTDSVLALLPDPGAVAGR